MKVKKNFIALTFLVAIASSLQAQNQYPQFERGVYFGGTLGDTNLSDDRSSWMVRPFINHRISGKLDGEFAFGVGMLNSTEYRTRVIPVDYSLNFHPFRSDDFGRSGMFRSADVFAFAGLGLLNYHHTRVLRPDDPLTIDAGKTISNTEHWTLDKNWIAQAPVGVGTRIWVESLTSFIVKFGYTFTNSKSLSANPLDKKEGYWTASVGLSLGRGGREVVRPEPIPVYIEPIVEVVEPEVVPVEEPVVAPEPEVIEPVIEEPVVEVPAPLLPSMANFALLSTDLDDTAETELDRILGYLSYFENEGVILTGHTDSTGADQLNAVLGYQRAWRMKEWLVESGIEADRVSIESRSYLQPLGDNTTEAGRRQNRRVEFTSVSLDEISEGRPAWIESLIDEDAIEVGLVAVGEVVPVGTFEYSVMQMYPSETMASTLSGLYELMDSDSEMKIEVIGFGNGLPNAGVNALISESRASRIKEYLVVRGIDARRIKTVAEREWDSSVAGVRGKVLIIRLK